MKKYLIIAFHKYGVFECKEEKQLDNSILLIGKFNGNGEEYIFIKHSGDIEIN